MSEVYCQEHITGDYTLKSDCVKCLRAENAALMEVALAAETVLSYCRDYDVRKDLEKPLKKLWSGRGK